MGQASIPMLNKVGHSMYWNSMWDNKINYTANLSEDIFLKKFIPLLFGDSSSYRRLNFFNLDPKRLKIIKRKYRIHVNISGIKTKSFYKYINKIKKVEFYFSRVWILKFQKWVILYLYAYLPKFSKLKKSKIFILKQANINILHRNYNYASQKIRFSYSNADAFKKTFVF